MRDERLKSSKYRRGQNIMQGHKKCKGKGENGSRCQVTEECSSDAQKVADREYQ